MLSVRMTFGCSHAATMAALAVAALAMGVKPLRAAPLPSPERIVPDDTIALLTIPDTRAALDRWTRSSVGRIWLAEPMAAFRAQFKGGTNRSENSPPAWSGGQITLAVLRHDWSPGSTNRPAVVAVADGGGDATGWRGFLAALRRSLEAAGCTVGSRRIGEHDFMDAAVEPADLIRALRNPAPVVANNANAPLSPAVPEPGSERKRGSVRFYAGQFDSLFLAGTDPAVLAALLQRLQGEATNTLADAPRFAAVRGAGLRDADAYGWVDLDPVREAIGAWAQRVDAQADTPTLTPSTGTRTETAEVPMPSRMQLLEASGILGLRHLAVAARFEPGAFEVAIDIGLPAAERRGLLAAFAPENLGAAPDATVPVEVQRFQRLRLDLRKAWVHVEHTLTALFPQTPGVIRFLFQTAGAGGDGVDLKQELLAALGNDLTQYELPGPVDDLPLRVGWIGSTNAPRLIDTLEAVAGLLPAPMNELRATNIANHRFHALPMPSAASGASSPLWLTPAANGLLHGTDVPRLLQLLEVQAAGRGTTNPPALGGLPQRPGLEAAAARVGGMTNAYFGFEDLSRSLADSWTLWRSRTNLLDLLPELLQHPSMQWAQIDPRSLPTFEQVSPLLGVAVSSIRESTNGYVVRWCLESPPPPTPPPAPAIPAIDPAGATNQAQ